MLENFRHLWQHLAVGVWKDADLPHWTEFTHPAFDSIVISFSPLQWIDQILIKAATQQSLNGRNFQMLGKERRTNTFPILFIHSGSALSFILFTIHHRHSGPPLLHPVSRGKLSKLNVNQKLSVGRTVWCLIPLQWTILEIKLLKEGGPFYTDEGHSKKLMKLAT